MPDVSRKCVAQYTKGSSSARFEASPVDAVTVALGHEGEDAMGSRSMAVGGTRRSSGGWRKTAACARSPRFELLAPYGA